MVAAADFGLASRGTWAAKRALSPTETRTGAAEDFAAVVAAGTVEVGAGEAVTVGEEEGEDGTTGLVTGGT